jgi:hypothetical protein
MQRLDFRAMGCHMTAVLVPINALLQWIVPFWFAHGSRPQSLSGRE